MTISKFILIVVGLPTLTLWVCVVGAMQDTEDLKFNTISFPVEQIEGVIEKDVYWEIYIIEDLLDEVVNSHEYKLHIFDCTDFSKELVKKLKEKGINARCTAGYLKDAEYPSHTWVSVFIEDKRIELESTGGFIIDSEDYKENYEKRWESRCW